MSDGSTRLVFFYADGDDDEPERSRSPNGSWVCGVCARDIRCFSEETQLLPYKVWNPVECDESCGIRQLGRRSFKLFGLDSVMFEAKFSRGKRFACCCFGVNVVLLFKRSLSINALVSR